MSIRLRLTLWYTTILAAVVVIFGAALYYLLTLTLLGSVDQQLWAAAETIAESAHARMSPLLLERVIELPDLDILVTPGTFAQVWSAQDQQILDRSTSLGDSALPLDQETLDIVLAGQAHVATWPVGGQEWRVYSVPLLLEGRVEGVVQTGTSLAQINEAQRALLSIEVVVGLLAVAVSAGLGALLAHAALRPIDQITQTALTISRTKDLTRRLEVSQTGDEVGRLAATFNEMLARLEVLFHTQERFTADVSHELRTPLTTIQGNVDLLRRGAAGDTEARQAVLSDIEGEVARMSRMVDDLLLLKRVEAGGKLEKETVELDTLLLQVYRQGRLMSDGVQMRLGHEDQALVQGDPDRLRQLFLNLVDNALKYTPAGGEVTLSLYHDGDWVRVEVADTGIGISPADLAVGPNGAPLIFERFYRVDPSRSNARGGAGLGLSIVYWIVQAHKGKIEVQSTPGEGTCVTVWLPVSSTSA